MQRLLYLLVAASVFLMNTQHAIKIPVGKRALNLGVVDIVIWAAFGLWAVSAIIKRNIFRSKLPPVAFIALPVLAILSILRHSDIGAAKEIFQFVEYFIIAALLFINLAENETKLRGLISVFLMAVSAVVVWGLIDYMSSAGIFTAGGAFGNVNVLGAYFAVALPLVLGVALFDDLKTWQRISLVVPVVIGAAITLSGAALAATLAGLLLVLALRSPRVLLPLGLVIGTLGIIVMPRVLRHNHAKIVANSAAVYLYNNYLLDEDQLLERAQALYDDGRYFDARRVLQLIDDEDKLNDEGEKLWDSVEEKLGGRKPSEEDLPYDRPVVAVRYKRWQAALNAIVDNPWGYGLGTYQDRLLYGKIRTFGYRTDEVEAFNIGIEQPDTFNRFLVITVELGLPGLMAFLWLYLWALGRSVRLFGVSKSGLARGVAAGATASLAFLPIVAAYSDVLVRGVALPIVFIICCVYILGKEETQPE
jgi:hypothetical protein